MKISKLTSAGRGGDNFTAQPLTVPAAIQIERVMEQLRQEREVFDQQKKQEARWFMLRLIMGSSSVLLLFAVIIISAIVLFDSQNFPEYTVKAAGAALFADVVGLLVGVWKIVLKPDFITKLTPETKQPLTKLSRENHKSS